MKTKEILEKFNEFELDNILIGSLYQWELQEILDYCDKTRRFKNVIITLEDRILENIKDFIDECSFNVKEGRIKLDLDMIKSEAISIMCEYFYHYNRKTKIDILCDLEENCGLDLGLERFKEELENNDKEAK